MSMENIWLVITYLGDPRLWAALAVLFFALRMIFRRKDKTKFRWAGRFVLFVGFGMALAFGISELLKYVFQIPRICNVQNNLYCLDNYSFPSGHTTIAFSAATGVVSTFRNKWSLLVYIIAILAGLSRVMLGVHTWLDVAGGIVVGILANILFIEIIRRVRKFDRWTKN